MPISITYCTQAEMERKLSSAGVVAWSDHEEAGTADADVVADAIDQATEEINRWAMPHYTAASLAISTVVNRWCVTIACVFLCQSRGNPVPDSLASEFERIMLALEQTYKLDPPLPGIELRSDNRPTISNMEIDRRYRAARARVTQQTSTHAPTVLGQNHAEDHFFP